MERHYEKNHEKDTIKYEVKYRATNSIDYLLPEWVSMLKKYFSKCYD